MEVYPYVSKVNYETADHLNIAESLRKYTNLLLIVIKHIIFRPDTVNQNILAISQLQKFRMSVLMQHTLCEFIGAMCAQTR